MLDSYDRQITYLRISVTDRCNLRCTYCMPPEGITSLPKSKILRFDQIEEIVRAAATLGIRKIRITGGEPLVRKDTPKLIASLKKIEGIEFVGITTNGTLLRRFQKDLVESKVDRINISLDTLDPERYQTLTRGGNITSVLDGIVAMREVNIPVKLNMVVGVSTSKEDIARMQDFATQQGVDLQLIKEYRLTEEKQDTQEYHRPPKCEGCDKIRLLADGTLMPCLHGGNEIPIDMDSIEETLQAARPSKPQRGTTTHSRTVGEIGG